MSKSLKEFLKEKPNSREARELWAELKSDGPRGVAIAASAYIEDILKDVISFQLKSLNQSEKDALFEGTAPLATFSARIQIAYGLGLVGRKTRHDLDSIRTIRNAFAHSQRKISFETKAVVDIVMGLHAARDIIDYQQHDARTVYVAACQIMLLHLMSRVGPFEDRTMQIEYAQGITQLD